ncbi:N-acetyl-beta-glucosaminyl-glycoprotein 4-beta-N-acetylgalactosaminyltransferase 1 [Megalops cyprinoides]|uniref:N-acetyl-beta-glucosaminyl-glycoprotein 4-beta-N-acetylgalactosaminyltransferase 1 n=1 Tax=Megalops cyprinoides TaxID=118141 RepID=UPI0018656770|nr:N-acetyl-beta-glucosaminyl-glycoprotein 4-beta-N-acetylgalactosaminyltransferase 1 [Megalops cyprinoides]XP_036390658.1 N-acetyl-beta-glucosaminyl-glycoprotein 4-beta-N-acetylgalactosaminyltransferase 1 [Megalops cyprinoides]XP_036390659.1 N-acetyl-beta-glucosaminyl-glycoprotein 4-beta-N-acetylgalactosaminyltransferase 1 [Megalops cyprinoides]
MLRFPVKKIRKQFKLLLLLVLLTFAVWFTYLHINQGKAIKLHFNYGKDGERQAEGTDVSHKRDSRSSASRHNSEEVGDSREEEPAEEEPNAFEGESKDLADIRKFLIQKQNKLPWKPEYKGQANLHVFEDWCGSSVLQLRKNLHFPLYPHTRTTVKKLAVAPKWKNYGLRIFGFIHPYRDGDFQFAVASDDNSEFWLSSDESPLNARLLVYVGRLGPEWTAPGEFSKFRSQSSKSIHLISSRRYYFEILHKQDDKGSDHVEVGWRPFLPGLKYEIIDSAYISLYTDESGMKMNSVDHIPQTLASHSHLPQEAQPSSQHGADMLKPDPRDTFYSTPMIEPSRLENVLPACLYSPTYVVKDFPIARYQGLQFVYLSFVYPNDFTRLTHMEKENKCFYRESPIYLEKFGFYKYMKMDEEEDDRPFFFPNPNDFLEEEEGVDPEDEVAAVDALVRRANNSRSTRPPRRAAAPTPSEREDKEVDSYMPGRQRRYFPPLSEQRGQRRGSRAPPDPRGNALSHQQEEPEALDFHRPGNTVQGRSLSWIRSGPDELSRGGAVEMPPKFRKTSLLFPQKSSLPALSSRAKQILSNSAHTDHGLETLRANKEHRKDNNKIYITRPRPFNSRRGTTPHQPREVFPGVFLYQNGKTTKLVNLSTKPRGGKPLMSTPHLWPSFKDGKASLLNGNATRLSATHKASTRAALVRHNQRRRTDPWERGREPPASPSRSTFAASPSRHRHPVPTTTANPKPTGLSPSEDSLPGEVRVTSYLRTSEITESRQEAEVEPEQEQEEGEGGLSEYSYEEAEPRPGWAEEAINWQRTFSVNTMDFELLRSDWNDLRCNVSGNLQLAESEVVDVLAQYMEKLNERNGGIYTLLRIINVEKRRDSARGNRYLVELELTERGKRVVRLSEYIYLLLHRGRVEDSPENGEGLTTSAPAPATTTTTTTAAAAPAAGPAAHSTQIRATTHWGMAYVRPLLCQPVMLQWRRDVMVHFVVPVKNQARWVQQFITDMELLHHETKDDNFSIIIVDFESEDMDVEQALRDSKVPRYEYLRREGNFERSAGLQIGVDTIEDSHSIVFLCDLHIHFPLNILESIRKHCVEGRLAFAPIVMRLGCGSSPQEPDGYWEVNGFGLFGIYKSDFDKIGGMNTEEFKDRWGGEDWELLDRVLQNGLEVERLRLRNFFHYYHSKRGMWNAQAKKSPRG